MRRERDEWAKGSVVRENKEGHDVAAVNEIDERGRDRSILRRASSPTI